jgi:hypothetical protein
LSVLKEMGEEIKTAVLPVTDFTGKKVTVKIVK